MAVRLHVTAMRKTNAGEARRAYRTAFGEKADGMELHESNGWVWFLSSVWAVGADELMQGPELLGVPAIVFTTQDACRWIARFYMPDQESAKYAVVHEFFSETPREEDWTPDESEDFVDPQLEFLQTEEETADRGPKTALDEWLESQRFVGGLYPEALIEECRGLSFDQAMARIDQWQFDCLREFIASENLDVVWPKIEDTLRWKNLTEAEQEADIGNLPRLLSLLGLGGQWDEWVAQAENPDDEERIAAEADQDEATAYIDGLLGLLERLPQHDIVGDPVLLELDRLHLVQFIPERCGNGCLLEVLLSITFPPDGASEIAKFQSAISATGADAEIRWEAGRLLIGSHDPTLLYCNELNSIMGTAPDAFWNRVPDGSRLQIVFGEPDTPDAQQQYSGLVREGVWLIDRSSVALRTDVLRDALELAELAEGDGDITYLTARDAEEARTIVETIQADSFLKLMNIERQGLKLSAGDDNDDLASVVFRIRFGDVWQFADAEDDEQYETFANATGGLSAAEQSQYRRQIVESARRMMAVRLGKPLFRGEATAYFRSDLLHFDELDAAPRERFQSAMRELNYRLLGDLTTKRFRDYVLRCYASPDRLCFATLTGSRLGYLCYDFVSRFSDGSILISTTSPMVESCPRVKVFYLDYPGLSPQELMRKHRSKFDNFRQHKQADPVELVASLEGLAEVFDESLGRVDRDQSASVILE